MPDRNPFMDWTTLKGDSIIGVYSNDWKGTSADKGQFVEAIGDFDKYAISDLVVVASPMLVSANQPLVDESLAVLRNCKKI